MAAGVPGNISSGGSSSTCRTDHLLSLARAGEPTSTVRALPDTSSERRSEASGGATRHADDAERMGKQEVPSAYAMGGRGWHHRRRSSSSYGSRAAPLTHHHSASPPVSGRKTNGGDDASSFVALRLVSRNFQRQLHSSQWITLAITVVCIACFPTPTSGFQMHPDVESAANVLRGLNNINEIQNQLRNEIGVVPGQPFDWGPLFFLSAFFLVWLIIVLLGGISAGEQPAPLLPQVFRLDSGIAIIIAVSLAIIGVIFLAWRFL